jgi:uncharacterized membrane protein YhaH (DUF805 family)
MYGHYWRRMFDFSGRARRRDFWLCMLIDLVVLFFLAMFDVILAAVIGLPILAFLFPIATIIPTIAISVRRLHDIGKSGYWYFLILVPLVGAMVLFVFACLDSQPGDNIYGANPKGK